MDIGIGKQIGHSLNFGPGPNQLPPPWQNLDPSHDIRKRLKFESESVRRVLAEHVIEHVPFLQALGFFRECLRILEPGGVLRIAFPDVSRFLRFGFGDEFREFDFIPSAEVYAAGLSARPGMKFGPTVPEALWQMLTGWGHQMAWTSQSAAGALLVVGFSRVTLCDYGKGAIEGVDGHHRDVGPELAEMESTILEATK